MSTRAVYTFIDDEEKFSVYNHWDNYPENTKGYGAYAFIESAKKFAWDLPRFEASEFATAFIRAIKEEGGGKVYLSNGPQNHADLSYFYEIRPKKDKLEVKTFDAYNPKKVLETRII